MGCGDHKNGLFGLLGFFFFPGWTLKLNTSDSLREPSYGRLAALMETRLRFSAPQQKGQPRGLGKNVNVDLMVLCFRDVIEQAECAEERLRTCFSFSLYFFFLFPLYPVRGDCTALPALNLTLPGAGADFVSLILAGSVGFFPKYLKAL